MTTATVPASPSALAPAGFAQGGEPSEGLRERKKRLTRQALHRAALELADELGLEAVTVEAIAERAEVSARTFFNYYPSKDEAMVGYDPSVADRLRSTLIARPPDESPVQAIRAVLTQHLAGLEANRATWALRRKLAMSHPELAIRMLGAGVAIDRALVDGAVERSGTEGLACLPVMVHAYTAVGAFRAALNYHARGGFEGDPARLLDIAFDAVPRPNGAESTMLARSPGVTRT